MKYYSEETKQFYSTAEDCDKAEKAAIEEKEKKEAHKKELKEARAARAKEVNEAFEKANELLNKFVEDYGSFHYTYTNDDFFDSFFRRHFLL